MILRFLTLVPSLSPDAPFQPGQQIHVQTLTPEMRAWLKDGSAELIREDTDPADAVADAPDVERAVTKKGRH